jgi:hypothetical protein
MRANLSPDALAEGFREVCRWIDQESQQWEGSSSHLYLPHIVSATTDFYAQYQDTNGEVPNSIVMDSVERMAQMLFLLGWLYRDRKQDFEKLYRELDAKYGTSGE